MREILFRGKDISGNWHYGVPLVFTEDYICMTAPNTYNKKVEIGTIGQYTGLTDKNATKIFEHDIATAYSGSSFEMGEIVYDECLASYIIKSFANAEEFVSELTSIEIIGNIHDNPELLGA